MRLLLFLLVLVWGGCSDAPHRLAPPASGWDTNGQRDAGPDALHEDPGPPARNGELAFELGYLEPAQTAELGFDVAVRSLDVHFSIDTTGSFGEEIDELQATLADRIIPGIRDAVADTTFGISRFEDFPLPPFGAADDRPFRLEQPQTSNSALAVQGVRRLDDPLGDGGDLPESSAEALYQIATGEGFVLDGVRIVEPASDDPAPGGGNGGGAGFRPGALAVVVQVTDAASHSSHDYALIGRPTHDLDEATSALSAMGAAVVGVASGEQARPYLEAVAMATGAVAPSVDDACATGIDGDTRPVVGGRCPLVYDILPDGSGLSESLVGAVTDLLATIVFESVSIEILGDDLGFVIEATPLSAQVPPATPPPRTADLIPAGGDGALDSFTGVRPGSSLLFRLRLRNETVRESDYPQTFFLRARIVADRATVLDDMLIEVTVPSRSQADAGSNGSNGSNDAAAPDAGERAP